MNKLPMCLGMIVCLCMTEVLASDSTILQVPYCYNVSFTLKQVDGNFSAPSFAGCSLDDGLWFCDCHDTIGTFNLTLHTNGNYVYPARHYKLDLSYTTYEVTQFSDLLIAEDYGTYARSIGDEPIRQGLNIVQTIKPIYVNRTVFVDRVVNNTQFVDRVVYVDRNITVVEYVENTSKIEGLNKSLENCSITLFGETKTALQLHNERNSRNVIILGESIMLLGIGIGIINHIYGKKKVKS